IYDQFHINNRIYIRLYEKYAKIWWHYKPKLIRTVPNFYKVFISLRKYGFYEVETFDDFSLDNLEIPHKIWKRSDIFDHADYGYINDPILFDMMFLDSFRDRLKSLIISSL
ncbi:MAG: hypothetical protein K2K64_09190, partial [Muribaculaceae bacterium]|nr:hypothetical protein [Muribaculaceae bacterium]